jgi:YaiO family outer membrane protein
MSCCCNRIPCEPRGRRLRTAGSALALGALALLLATCALPGSAAGSANTAEERARLLAQLRYRLDGDLIYEHLAPEDGYGQWLTAVSTLYMRLQPDLTPFVQVAGSSREKGGPDGVVVAGAYAGWGAHLSTYTAVAAGSRSDWLPARRLDHDFVYHLGPWSWVLGGGLLASHRGHDDWWLATGPRFWLGRLVGEYRLTRQQSDPGDLVAWNHLLSFGRGAEGDSWLFLTLTAGQERYTATTVVPPQAVDHDTWSLSLSYARWVGPTWGWKANAGYADVDAGRGGYRKYTIGGGMFMEF